MREATNKKCFLLLYTIILLGAQLSLALNPTLDVSASNDLSSFPNERILEYVTIYCDPMSCPPVSSSVQNQTSPLVFEISFQPQSRLVLQIEVGKPKTVLDVRMQSLVTVPMLTTFALIPMASAQDVSISSLSGSNWDNPLSFGSSSGSSSRKLIVTIENDSQSQTTLSYFTITVISTGGDDDSTSSGVTGGAIGGAIGGAVGGVIVLVVIAICIRRRKLMKRPGAQASYQTQNIQQFPSQQPSIYQPIHPNSPNYLLHQPGGIHYSIMADPNYQQQINIQYASMMTDPNYQSQPSFLNLPTENYPQSDYQGQGIQLAPPIQMAMYANQDEGPLSEMNFNYRFPEAPFQNFSSSFPQKACSVCLEDLNTDQNCRQLYCEHIFHGECAKVWLLNRMVKKNQGCCPNCNKNMTFVLERIKS